MVNKKIPEKIRFAIIGYGKMGKYHEKALIQLVNGAYERYYNEKVLEYLDSIELDSLVDPVFDRGNTILNGISRFKDRQELLEYRKIDAAIISAPISRHYDIAGDLIKKGIRLLIEKPVAPTSKEVHSLEKLAENNDVFIMPGHVERYNPAAFEVKELMESSVYGKMKSYRFTRTSRRPRHVDDSIILDKLVHDLDLLLYFFGKPTIEKTDFKYDTKGTVVEARVILSHRNGATGEIYSSWLVPDKVRKVNIYTASANIEADFIKKNVIVEKSYLPEKTVICYNNNQIKDMIVDFIAGSYGVTEPYASIKDALESGMLIDKIRELSKK